jgi:dihydroorotate dehydrogenase electron transfer subunit
MKRFDTSVSSIRPVAEGYHELRFAWPSSVGSLNQAELPAPGRFFTIKAGGRYDPALRRPFAFSGFEPGIADGRTTGSATDGVSGGGEAAFVFQVRGRGTGFLAALRPGDGLDVLGPLGKGFGRPANGSKPILIAGGIGVGPMLYLAHALAKDAKAGLFEAPILAMGFRNASYIPALPLPDGTVVCTDDGSAGYHGTVTLWLEGFDPGAPPCFYACGPAPMMAAVDRIAQARGVPYEAAIEQWMACGVGACAGCAVALKSGGYIKACADGPVYDGRLIDWETTR